MGTKCLIRFDDNPNKVFYGGQMIVGTVLLTLAKEQPVKGLYLFVGCVLPLECVSLCENDGFRSIKLLLYVLLSVTGGTCFITLRIIVIIVWNNQTWRTKGKVSRKLIKTH